MVDFEFSAGTGSKGDCIAVYRPGSAPLSIDVSSSTGDLFRRAVLEAAEREASRFFPSAVAGDRIQAGHRESKPGGSLRIQDEGALDYVVEARVEAVFRAAGLPRNEPLARRPGRPAGRSEGGQRRRRSRLYLPGNQPDLYIHAGLFGADCLVLDLEDSVSPGRKAEARFLAARLLSRHREFLGTSEISVRVNPLDSPWGVEDLETIVPMAPDALVLPKCESPEQILAWEAFVARLEECHDLSPGSIHFYPLIETAQGVSSAARIAAASARTVALSFGAEDFRSELGLPRTPSEEELAVPRSLIVIAARSAGKTALDSVYAALDDPDGLRASAARARALGFSGKSLIHPSQIDIVNEAFSPTAEEIAWAQNVLKTMEDAAGRGRGAAALDGFMVDAPLHARALEILAFAGDQHE